MPNLPAPGVTTNWGDDVNAAIESLHLTGTHAARPSTDLVTGTLYSCTDHALVYRWTGSAWATWGGSGALTLISAQTLTTATQNIDFTAIPGTYRDLIVEAKMRSNRAATINDNITVTVGTGGVLDTGSTSYRSSMVAQTNATFVLDTNSTGRANLYAVANACPAATADADVWGTLRLTLLDYANAAYWRVLDCEAVSHSAGTGSGYFRDVASGHWRNKAGAIDTLRITAFNGQFIAGSSFRLYGRS